MLLDVTYGQLHRRSIPCKIAAGFSRPQIFKHDSRSRRLAELVTNTDIQADAIAITLKRRAGGNPQLPPEFEAEAGGVGSHHNDVPNFP